MDPALMVVLLAAGLVMIVKGSDVFIDGAVSIAHLLGVSEHIIGLTLVAFATSTPEIASSAIAASKGHTDLVLGNVVGSNMANIGLALGLVLIIKALSPEKEARKDGIVMVSAVAVFLLLSMDGVLTLFDGAVFLVLYCGFFYHLSRGDHSVDDDVEADHHMAKAVALTVGGCVGIVVGAWFLVEGAVGAARTLGVSQTLIGLTIVAIGTSLPEVSASLAAVLKGSKGIAVGNIMGSNIINIWLVLGLASLITPVEVAGGFLSFQGAVLLIVSIILAVMVFRKMTRWMGIILLILYFPIFLFT